MSPLQLLQRAASRGMDVVAVTDHNRLEGALECAALAAADPSLPRVIVGEEMSARQGDIIGLFLKREIEGGLDVLDTISLIREQGGIVYLPHPFDSRRRASMDPAHVEQVAAQVDVIEVANGRALTPAANALALDLASRWRVKLGAGSDAHYPGEVGRSYLQLPAGPALAALPALSAPTFFLDALRFARPCGPPLWSGLSRSWFYCLRTGLLIATRRSRLGGPAGVNRRQAVCGGKIGDR